MIDFCTFVRNRLYDELNLNLRTLALRLGFDTSYLSEILCEIKTPPKDISKLIDFAKALEFEEGTPDFDLFIELALIQAGKETECLENLEKARKNYPFLPRFADGSIPTKEQYQAIIDATRSMF